MVNALALLDDLRHTLSCRDAITEVKSCASILRLLAAVCSGVRAGRKLATQEPQHQQHSPEVGGVVAAARRLPSGGVFVTAPLRLLCHHSVARGA